MTNPPRRTGRAVGGGGETTVDSTDAADLRTTTRRFDLVRADPALVRRLRLHHTLTVRRRNSKALDHLLNGAPPDPWFLADPVDWNDPQWQALHQAVEW